MQPDLTQNSAATTPAVEALRESENRYRHLFENLNDAALLADAETGIILDANRQAETLFGRPRDEIVGTHQTELHPPGKADEYRRRFGAHVAGGRTADYDGEIVKKDGTVVPISIGASPLTLGGQVLILGLFRDITERKRAEETLRESRERLLKAQRVARMGFLDWNLKTNEMYWSDEVFSIFGIDPKTKPTRELTMQLVHPDDLEFVEKNQDLAVSGLRPYDIDHRNLRPDGTVIWVHSQAQLVHDAAGNPERLLGTVVDITGRKQFEAALAESEERYRALFEQAADSIVLVDPRTASFIDFNDRAHENLGYTREEFARLRIADFDTAETHDDILRHAESVLTGGGETFETKMRTKNGDVRDILVSTKAISIAGDTFISSIWRDITERKRAEAALRQSEERYRTTINSMGDAIHVVDADLRIVLANRRFTEWLAQLGHDTDVVGKHLLEAVPFLPDATRRRYARVFQSGETAITEHREVVGGRQFATEVRKIPVFEDDRVVQVIAVIRDITERKRAEEALRESERKYRDVVEMASDGITIIQDGLVKYVNPRVTEIVGYSAEELIGTPFANYIHPEELAELVEVYKRRMAGEEVPQNYEARLRHKNGSDVHVEITGRLVTYQGEPADLGMVRDVTGRKRAEEALKRSEREKAAVLDSMSALVAYQGPDMRIRWANRAAGESVGMSPDQLVGRHCYEIWPKRQEPCTDCPVAKTLQTDRCHEGEMTTPDGKIWHVRSYPVKDASGSIEGVVEVTQDITKRKRAEEALRESEKKYRDVVEMARDGIAIVQNGLVKYVNPQVTEMIGYSAEELIGAPFVEYLHPDELAETVEFYKRRMAGKEVPRNYERRLRHKNGSDVYVEISGRVVPYQGEPADLAVIRDVTERKRAEQERRELEAQVQHAQKLESLGVLAGGIAHDFNNLLAGVIGNVDLALLELPETSAARTCLEEIKAAGVRASNLTRQMLAYSGRGQFVVKALDLNDVVSEVAHLLHASISKKATISFDLAEELGAIEADAAQVQQVVMNLITNASDAIGERAGVIAIRTQMVDADRALLSQGLAGEELPEGRYVMLEVTDTGRGMDGETRAKVFDPFFTTKFAGRGLGLAAVLGIVRGHGGTIMVSSEPGAGTTFTILFPCSARLAEAPEPELPAAAWHGTGTILVVDDEQLVSGVATRILEHAGFTVLTASRASEGVEMFRAHADQIVAVLLDMTMPEMSGAEVYRELRRVSPDVPVILTSGYNEQDAVGHFADEELAGFVAKPFEIDTLISAVRQALGG